MLNQYESVNGEDMTMLRRSCSTCAAFTPAERNQVSSCANRVPVVRYLMASEKMQKPNRNPQPDDWCSYHHTHEEDRQKDAAIDTFWQRLAVSENQSTEIHPSA
ncbi:hypothetical protein [Polaromonas glacialis]|uniref:hypothetical protein n=1 Tax=Polaromonas glacialis TaxID=866564 RepID=UPI0012EC8573|nr:hypothetical protein [Polaromonas glacialis]